MKQKIKQIIRLMRTIFMLVLVIWAWVFIYAQKDNWYNEVDRIQQIQDFYINSWYTNEREYKKDIEYLRREKQTILDTFSYKETIQFYNDGTYVDSISEITVGKLLVIDELIKEATQRIIDLPDPDYTLMNQSSKKETESGELDFIKLLK